MAVPAFAVEAPRRARLPALVPLAGALCASAVGTLLAVLAAVLAARANLRQERELALALAAMATLAVPAIALIVHGLAARGVARVVAGGALAAPAAAVYYLFEDPRWILDDAGIASLLAVLAAGAALAAWRLERRAGVWGWWLMAAPALATLWLVAVTLVPAQVWVELPW